MLMFFKWLSILTPLLIIGFSIYYLVDNFKHEKSKIFTAYMICFILISLLALGVVIYVELGMLYVV